MTMKSTLCAVTLAVTMGLSSMALAAATPITISIKDHKFDPAEVKVPAGEKVKLLVKNLDTTPEEFESHDLNREKIITGNSEAVINIGPLKPGKYEFFGEFNPKTARGFVIVE